MSDLERIFRETEHAIATRFPHPHPAATISTSTHPGGHMDLATIEADTRDAVQNAMTALTHVTEEVLPKLASAASDAQSDPLVQAIESVFLPTEAKTLLATLVTKLGTPVEAATTPAETEPAEAAEATKPAGAPSGPVVGGAAT